MSSALLRQPDAAVQQALPCSTGSTASWKFARRHKTAVSLLMLDLDHFKRVNDDARSPRGRRRARATWRALLQRAVRNEDVVARFGGEELAVVLRATAFEPAMHLAERLRKMVETTPMPVPRAGSSIHGDGVDRRAPASRRRPSGLTVEALIEAADQALYRARSTAAAMRVARWARLCATVRGDAHDPPLPALAILGCSCSSPATPPPAAPVSPPPPHEAEAAAVPAPPPDPLVAPTHAVVDTYHGVAVTDVYQ